VSKRHQSNRRKSYGRRQHELSERRQHDQQPDAMELGFEAVTAAGISGRLAFLDPRSPTLHLALGD
jgi:hypothetical protein